MDKENAPDMKLEIEGLKVNVKKEINFDKRYIEIQ